MPVARQEPGKNFGNTVVPTGPHNQVAIVPPAAGAVQPAGAVAPASVQGIKATVPLAPVAMPWASTSIRPAAVVLMLPTYLLVAVVDSQPHAPAAGSVEADCTISVMLVRQDEAAKITSDILARAV